MKLKQFFVKPKIIKILLWIQCHDGCWHDDYIAFKVYVKLNNFWKQFADNLTFSHEKALITNSES